MEFIKGMDISMQDELENNGALYYLNNECKDIFEMFSKCGVNYIRLRIWDNPYTLDNVAYGGGTNDLKTTIKLAKRIKKHNMKFLLDIHYSDFWVDPAKQTKPKRWQSLEFSDLLNEVYIYTKNILEELEKEKVLPDMIQIGNEITNGLLWPDGHFTNTRNMALLLKQGIKAVREFNKNIKIILHLDFGTDNKMYNNWFSKTLEYSLDFDIIGMSYYPFWNGSLEDLLFNMNDMSKKFNKDIIICETSIGYTLSKLGLDEMIFTSDLEEKTPYEATKKGQMEFLKDLFNTVRNVCNDRGLGVFYWEPSWLPIKNCAWAKKEGCLYNNDLVEPSNIWANQALFDENGNANIALIKLKDL